MRRRKQKESYVLNAKTLNFVFFVMVFVFVIIFINFAYLATATNVRGVNLQQFAANRNTANVTLTANRGTIFDSHGNPLAINIRVYTLIAYVDPIRSEGSNRLHHVEDKETTARKLAEVLNGDEATIYRQLNRNAFQVEFGRVGRNITELTKEEIRGLGLPGLDFIPQYRRHYPHGDFLSYVLGYARTNDEGEVVGEMGLESFYNEKLTGVDGYSRFQRNLQGFRIAGTPEQRKEPVDGYDIHLTIDSSIQLFLERTVNKYANRHRPRNMFMSVMEPQSGRILGVASYPSFDPNRRNIQSFVNPLVAGGFEPGSTVKMFTYLASIANGTYDGSRTFRSGSREVGPDLVNDWNPDGWGRITYDRGFSLSSNVGIANMVERDLSRQELHDFFDKLGFGRRTGFPLGGEERGAIDFRFPLEVMNAGFGQGMVTTPIQMMQASTVIANEGEVIKPFIVDKIVNPNTDEIVKRGERTVLNRVATKEDIEVLKDLMYDAVNCGRRELCTGHPYHNPDINIIGKTGTAQVAAPGGGYLRGENNTIRSFVALFPKEDPQFLIYLVVKQPRLGYGTMLPDAFREVVADLKSYKELAPPEEVDPVVVRLDTYLNRNVNDAKKALRDKKLNPVVIGNGNRVIKQVPRKNHTLLHGNRVFLLTNGRENRMPNMNGWPVGDVANLATLLGVRFEISGSGFVTSQSPRANARISGNQEISVELRPRF